MIVISDTSCISNLHIIGKLDLLHLLFNRVIIPSAVYSELSALGQFYPELRKIESFDWIEIKSVTDTSLLMELKQELDAGESEAISLAKELSADVLIIDETQGRKIATKLGINIIGLLGILIQAKRKNFITSVRPVLDALKVKAGFWVGEQLYESVLKSVGE